MIDLIIEVARQIKADQHAVSLRELHNAYLQAYPGISKGKTSYGFDATVNFYTVNMRSRFPDHRNRRMPASWLSKPTFKRVGRGQYMLLSSEEIVWFRQYVEVDNPLVYEDVYDVDALRTDMAQNPWWTRDETILVLELYFQVREHLSEKDARIGALSEQINALGITPNGARRTADGVYLKLLNFEYLDPANPGSGLADGARRTAKDVWDEFGTRRDLLTQAAEAIRHRDDAK